MLCRQLTCNKYQEWDVSFDLGINDKCCINWIIEYIMLQNVHIPSTQINSLCSYSTIVVQNLDVRERNKDIMSFQKQQALLMK